MHHSEVKKIFKISKEIYHEKLYNYKVTEQSPNYIKHSEFVGDEAI